MKVVDILRRLLCWKGGDQVVCYALSNSAPLSHTHLYELYMCWVFYTGNGVGFKSVVSSTPWTIPVAPFETREMLLPCLPGRTAHALELRETATTRWIYGGRLHWKNRCAWHASVTITHPISFSMSLRWVCVVIPLLFRLSRWTRRVMKRPVPRSVEEELGDGDAVREILDSFWVRFEPDIPVEFLPQGAEGGTKIWVVWKNEFVDSLFTWSRLSAWRILPLSLSCLSPKLTQTQLEILFETLSKNSIPLSVRTGIPLDLLGEVIASLPGVSSSVITEVKLRSLSLEPVRLPYTVLRDVCPEREEMYQWPISTAKPEEMFSDPIDTTSIFVAREKHVPCLLTFELMLQQTVLPAMKRPDDYGMKLLPADLARGVSSSGAFDGMSLPLSYWTSGLLEKFERMWRDTETERDVSLSIMRIAVPDPGVLPPLADREVPLDNSNDEVLVSTREGSFLGKTLMPIAIKSPLARASSDPVTTKERASVEGPKKSTAESLVSHTTLVESIVIRRQPRPPPTGLSSYPRGRSQPRANTKSGLLSRLIIKGPDAETWVRVLNTRKQKC